MKAYRSVEGVYPKIDEFEHTYLLNGPYYAQPLSIVLKTGIFSTRPEECSRWKFTLPKISHYYLGEFV